MPLPNRLETIRAIRGMTQAEVSAIAKATYGASLDISTISRHENGSRGVDAEHIKLYSTIYRVPERLLFKNLSSYQEVKRYLQQEQAVNL